MPLEPNYRYVLDRLADIGGAGAKILDYGCGAGAIVKAGRDAGLDIVGCDVFYGGNVPAHERAGDLLNDSVFEMKDGRIPFPANSFDVIVSNQVFEHVPDMDLALDEVRRVLRPGGAFLNIFPSIGVIREGHCGVVGAHWLNPVPGVQRAWLRLGFTLGSGYHRQGKTADEWAKEFSHYLRNFTVYRSMSTIKAAHRKRFSKIEWLEPDYIAFRLDLRGRPAAAKLARGILAPAAKIAARRLGSMVLLARD